MSATTDTDDSMSFLGLLLLCLFDNNHRHGRDMTQRSRKHVAALTRCSSWLSLKNNVMTAPDPEATLNQAAEANGMDRWIGLGERNHKPWKRREYYQPQAECTSGAAQ
jgi:hypothetical protein